MKSLKSLAVVASAALVLGAVVAGPAEAKKKKKPKPAPIAQACPTFTPVAPPEGEESEEATTVPVTKVTDEHTAEAPLVFEYEHGPAVHDPAQGTPVQTDVVWFNLQVDSSLPQTGLHLRQEWDSASPDDMDLYLYDSTGAEVDSSGAFNATPVDAVVYDFSSGGRGGLGYESIPGFPTTDCAGFEVESRAFLTDGKAMTLKVWLGEPEAAE